MESVFSLIILLVFGVGVYFFSKRVSHGRARLVFIGKLLIVLVVSIMGLALLQMLIPLNETFSSIIVLLIFIGYWFHYSHRNRDKLNSFSSGSSSGWQSTSTDSDEWKSS